MIEPRYKHSNSRSDLGKNLIYSSPERNVATDKDCDVVRISQMGESSSDFSSLPHLPLAKKIGCNSSQSDNCTPPSFPTNHHLTSRYDRQRDNVDTGIEQLWSRLLVGGHTVMTESELLELLLEGLAPQKTVRLIAQRLLSVFGHLCGVVAASEHRVLMVQGITPEMYLRLRITTAVARRMGQSKILKKEVLSCWKDLIIYCRTIMAHRDTEQFRIFFLDKKNTIIADEEQGSGTVDHVPVYPREIAKRALELNASALILIHNHPSGDPAPSTEDIHMTLRVLSACETIGVTIHDHVIIGKGAEFSFKAEGLLAGCKLTE